MEGPGFPSDEVPAGWMLVLQKYFLVTGLVIFVMFVVLAAIGGCWYVTYKNFLKDMPIIQELLGKKRQHKISKEQVALEIRKIKRQHSQTAGPARRSVSLTRQSSGYAGQAIPAAAATAAAATTSPLAPSPRPAPGAARVAAPARQRYAFHGPSMQPMSVCG